MRADGPFNIRDCVDHDLQRQRDTRPGRCRRHRRKQLYADLNNMLLDEVYMIGMSPTVNRLMATSKVHGIASTLHVAQKWWEVWLA